MRRGRSLAREGTPSGSSCRAVQEQPVVTVPTWSSSRAHPKRRSAATSRRCMCRSGCGACAAAPRRSIPPQHDRPCRARPSPSTKRINIAAEARHRPRGRRAVQRRRADHHQWRHHDLPDGALPDGRRMPVFTNSFAIAEHLLKHSQEHGDAAGRHDLPRAEHHPVARSTTT